MITYDELLKKGKAGTREPSDHDHDLEYVEFNIEGHPVKGMVCKACGERFFFIEDLLPIEEELRTRETGSEAISPEDAFLLLAGTYPGIEIPGRVVTQKEMFLFEKSFAPEHGVHLQSMGFVPFLLGPYSEKVKQTIARLISNGIIEIRSLPGRKGSAYLLTERGKRLAEEKRALLSPEVWEALRSRRRAWDELGSLGLLKLVYKMYSAYASKSEIRELVE